MHGIESYIDNTIVKYQDQISITNGFTQLNSYVLRNSYLIMLLSDLYYNSYDRRHTNTTIILNIRMLFSIVIVYIVYNIWNGHTTIRGPIYKGYMYTYNVSVRIILLFVIYWLSICC